MVPPAGLPLHNLCHAEFFAQKRSRTGEAVDSVVPHCPRSRHTLQVCGTAPQAGGKAGASGIESSPKEIPLGIQVRRSSLGAYDLWRDSVPTWCV